jgi:hypothetical protein
MRTVPAATAWVALVFLLASPAEAYIDPGVGSYVFQTLVALFFAAAFTLKTQWGRLKVFFSRLLSRPGRDGHAD